MVGGSRWVVRIGWCAFGMSKAGGCCTRSVYLSQFRTGANCNAHIAPWTQGNRYVGRFSPKRAYRYVTCSSLACESQFTRCLTGSFDWKQRCDYVDGRDRTEFGDIAFVSSSPFSFLLNTELRRRGKNMHVIVVRLFTDPSCSLCKLLPSGQLPVLNSTVSSRYASSLCSSATQNREVYSTHSTIERATSPLASKTCLGLRIAKANPGPHSSIRHTWDDLPAW